MPNSFIENVNILALKLSQEFIDIINTISSIPNMKVDVISIAEGLPATATWDDLTSTLSISIPLSPTGPQGIDGISAYQVALNGGFIGTEIQWIASLKGDQGIQGTTGANGISAYEVALDNGFIGTQIQWIASLKGEQGIQGVAGADGTMTFTDLTAEQIASLKGEQGIQGVAGVDGSDGISAYQVALNGGFVGTEIQWIASLKGEQGIQGVAGADGSDGISAYQVALNGGFVGTEIQWIASLKGEQGIQGVAGADGTSSSLTKPHQGAPLFTKASVSTITIPIGTSVKVGANVITVSGSAYTLSLNSVAVGALDTGTKAAGTDYYVYALEAGGFILSANATNPTGYTTANSRKIGGFHYGVIPEAFTAINNIVAADVTMIAGINAYTFWDLKFMPACGDARGMFKANTGKWYDLYLLNVDHHTFGTSAAGKTIAGGTVLNGRNFPKIPLFYGGNGTTTYGTLTWFEAAEIGKAYGKDLISYEEFAAIAYGVLEASSAGAADTGVTQHLANYTSKFGMCMATGCQYIWGKDLIGPVGAAWNTNTEGRGSIYNASLIAALFGGHRDNTVESGSRNSDWGNTVWNTPWGIGSRYACNHLELA